MCRDALAVRLYVPLITWRGIAATKFEKENIEPQNTEYRMPKCNNFVILHSWFENKAQQKV